MHKIYTTKILLLSLLMIVLFATKSQAQGPSPIYTKPSNPFGTRENRRWIDSALFFPTFSGAPTDSTFLFSYGFNGYGQKPAMAALYYDSTGHHLYVWDPSYLYKTWHIVDSGGSGGGGGDSSIFYTNYRADTSSGNIYNALAGKQYLITLGDITQYIRGDGSLATSPTNLSQFTNPGFIDSVIATGAITGNGVTTPLNIVGYAGRTTAQYIGTPPTGGGTTVGWYNLPAGGSGTVSAIATGFGLLGGTLTTTGTLLVDSTKVPTLFYLNGTFWKKSDTTSTLATQYYVNSHIPAGALTQLFGKGGISILGTDTVVADTVSRYATKFYALSLDTTILNGSGILSSTSGKIKTLKADTSLLATEYFVNNIFDTTRIVPYSSSGITLLRGSNDSLRPKPIVAGSNITLTQNSDSTVTIASTAAGVDSSVAVGLGLLKSISGTNITLKADTSYLVNKLSNQTIGGNKTFNDTVSLTATTYAKKPNVVSIDSLTGQLYHTAAQYVDTTGKVQGAVAAWDTTAGNFKTKSAQYVDTTAASSGKIVYWNGTNFALETNSGGGTDSAIVAGSGILKSISGTNITLKADTSLLATQYDVGLKQNSMSGNGFPYFTGSSITYYNGASSTLYGVGSTGGSGVISLGTGLTMTGTTLSASGSGGITQLFAKAPLSILGTDTVKADTSTANTGLATLYQAGLKVKYSDTSSMLSTYANLGRKNIFSVKNTFSDTVVANGKLDFAGIASAPTNTGKISVLIQDTTTNFIARASAQFVDTTGASSGKIVYWNGTNFALETNSGGGTDSAVLVGNGILKSTSGTNITLKLDTSIASTQYDVGLKVKYSDTGSMLSPYVRSATPTFSGLTTNGALLYTNGSGNVTQNSNLLFDATNNGIKLISTSIGTGTTINKGLYAQNTTVAASGSQQYGPFIGSEGQGWKTTSTAASEPVWFGMRTETVQGSTAPTGNLQFYYSVNGGTLAPSIALGSTGAGGNALITTPSGYGLILNATTGPIVIGSNTSRSAVAIALNSNGGSNHTQWYSSGNSLLATMRNGGSFGLGVVPNDSAYLYLAAPTAAMAQINFAKSSNVDPTNLHDGDLWYDSLHFYFRHVGVTTDLLASGGTTYYQTVQANTTSQTQRAKLNFGTEFTVADNSGNGSTDVSVNAIAESKVTNLTSDLSAKAPLASPALTGTPTAPTASSGTNTTQVATTAFVQGATGGINFNSLQQIVVGSNTSGTINNGIAAVTFNDLASKTTYALTLPSSPVDGQVVYVYSNPNLTIGSTEITTFSIVANSGQSIYMANQPTTLIGGNVFMYRWSANLSQWLGGKLD